MRDDLVLGFLYLHQLAKFGGFACFAFAHDFGVRLEYANDFAGNCVSPWNTRAFVSRTTCRTRLAISVRVAVSG